jgi:hypothetical protein
MNTDDLLIEFRVNVPLPNEETKQRIYSRATGRHRRLPRRKLVSVIMVAVAAVAGVGAAALAGAFTGGATPTSRTHPSGGGLDAPYDALTVTPNRNDDGTLASISVTVKPDIANATSEIEVLHSDGSATGTTEVVFREQVSTTPLPGPDGLSTWSGTLYPSDWTGGCQSGTYGIRVVSVPPGTSLADPGTNREIDGTALRFSWCG